MEATFSRRWTWRGDAYASGSVERAWTDVPALDLEPLRPEDLGIHDLKKGYEPFRRPDPYTEM